MRKVRAVFIALLMLFALLCPMAYAAEINDDEIMTYESVDIVDDNGEILSDEIMSDESAYIVDDSAEILSNDRTISTYPDDESEEGMEINLEPIAERLDDIFMQLVAMNIILAAIIVYLFIHNAIKTTFMR